MKKLFCSAVIIGIFSIVPAHAMVLDSGLENNNRNNLQTVQKELCYLTVDGREDCSSGRTVLPRDPVITDPVITDPEPNIRFPVDPVTPVIRDDLIAWDGSLATTATVSSCPSGTTMSADKCCCVNN